MIIPVPLIWGNHGCEHFPEGTVEPLHLAIGLRMLGRSACLLYPEHPAHLCHNPTLKGATLIRVERSGVPNLQMI